MHMFCYKSTIPTTDWFAVAILTLYYPSVRNNSNSNPNTFLLLALRCQFVFLFFAPYMRYFAPAAVEVLRLLLILSIITVWYFGHRNLQGSKDSGCVSVSCTFMQFEMEIAHMGMDDGECFAKGDEKDVDDRGVVVSEKLFFISI